MTEQRSSSRIDPMPTRDADWFWECAGEGRLAIQECRRCERLWHPPRPVCPECHGTDLAPRIVSGRGTIYSYIQVHYPPPIGFDAPPLIALVDLEEGDVRLISNIVDAELAEVETGAAVEVDFEKTATGKSLPVFRLTSGTASRKGDAS